MADSSDNNPIYRLIKRLGLLKPKLKSLQHQQTSHISIRVVEEKSNWFITHILLDGSPQFEEYQRSDKKSLLGNSYICVRMRRRFTNKRLGLNGLGEKITKFFHKSLLHRYVGNIICWLTEKTGSQVQDQHGLG